MELITKYFPGLSEQQNSQFSSLQSIYSDWNDRINVISRKDMDNFYERHVLHSLSIALFYSFPAQTTVLDVGTGGGFPGVPLAILYPDVRFHLIDSIGKKIKVVESVTKELGLRNVTAAHIRAEDVRNRYNFIVSRAVTRLDRFHGWVHSRLLTKPSDPDRSAIIALKGGDLHEEISDFENQWPGWAVQESAISDKIKEDFFATKKVLRIFKI